MKKHSLLILFIVLVNSAFGQYEIRGRIIDSDSLALPFTEIRIWGLDSQTTDQHGFFSFRVPESKREKYYIRGGVDLAIEVSKDGMVLLEPADGKIRLPYDPDLQTHFRIIMVKKGSPLLVRSERLLEHILLQRVEIAIRASKDELARRDILADEAFRLGVNKDELMAAITDYKDRLRTSPDLNKRGLVALDDANQAKGYEVRRQKLADAKTSFRESILKDERALSEGKAAEHRLPESYTHIGMTYFQAAQFDSARIYFTRADSLSPGDPEKLNWLGLTFDALSELDQALQVYGAALQADSSNTGQDRHRFSRTLNNIGSVLLRKGDDKEAMRYFEESFRLLAKDSSHTIFSLATSINNMAQVMHQRAQYDIALNFFGKALKLLREEYGNNEPVVASTLQSIGMIYYENGDYDTALKNYKTALDIYESILGHSRPEVAGTLNRIAMISRVKGDFEDALQLYEEALDIYKKYFGESHPEVATELENIGEVLLTKGDYTGAYENFRQALEIKTAYFGEQHPSIASVLHKIGSLFEARGQYPEALDKYTEALRIDVSYFGETHPRVASRLNSIGLLLAKQGKYDEALKKYNDALKIDQSYFGADHPNLATRLHNIASVLEMQGKLDEALEKYRQSLQITESHYGRNHPDVAVSLDNIASVLAAQGDFTRAQEKFNEALEIDVNFFGENHPKVARRLNNLALVLSEQGQFDRALDMFTRALNIQESHFGRNHPEVSTTLYNIGRILQSTGDNEGALDKYREAMKIDERIFGRNHPGVVYALGRIAETLAATGEIDSALATYKEAIRLSEDVFGPEHQVTSTLKTGSERLRWQSLSESERWYLQTRSFVTQLDDPDSDLSEHEQLSLLNGIGVGYIKQAKGDSAVIYLSRALSLAEKLDESEMIGTLLNNLGAAYKVAKQWQKAEEYLRRSISVNRMVVGDSASVLAYSYFHLGNVLHARAKNDSARFYIRLSETLARKHGLQELLEGVQVLPDSIDVK